jgi:hypothetical protein
MLYPNEALKRALESLNADQREAFANDFAAGTFTKSSEESPYEAIAMGYELAQNTNFDPVQVAEVKGTHGSTYYFVSGTEEAALAAVQTCREMNPSEV